MWAGTFFARSMWPGTFWPPSTTTTPAPPASTRTDAGGFGGQIYRRKKRGRNKYRNPFTGEWVYLSSDVPLTDEELVAVLAALWSANE